MKSGRRKDEGIWKMKEMRGRTEEEKKQKMKIKKKEGERGRL